MLRPPGPKPHFVIGNLPLAGPDPLGTFASWAKQYGDIFYYRAAWLDVYFLNRPDLIEYVLVRNPQNFLKDRVVRKSGWLLGQGLLTAEGEDWKRQRRLIQPAFSRERIAAYARYMTGCAQELLATWKSGAVVDVHEAMMALTLHVVLRALFESESAETQKISRCLNTVMLNSTGGKLILPAFLRYLPLPGMRDVRAAVRQMYSAVSHIVAERSQNQNSSNDLLSILIRARESDDSSLSEEQLRDEVMTFLLAGHETTALALSWALSLLGQNAGAQAKLQHEADRIGAGETLTMSEMPSLAYTDSVIKETLRLYPPAWSMAREAISDFELEGYRIPAGANIVMSQWIMHRDRRFFVDPESFDPERWSTPACKDLPRFAYFPFGGGPRQCIGASFAMTEAVLILATLARKFEFVAAENIAVPPVPSLTLRPKQPIRMRLEARR
jgi:cytochrome P450